MEEAAIKRGITASALMENAGRAVAEEARRMLKNGRVAVFCGYGNNGGDGLVAARYILKSGCSARVFLVGPPRQMSARTNANYRELIALGCIPEIIPDIKKMEEIFSNMPAPDLIIDAIFGIGMRGSLNDFYIKIINKINALKAAIIAVDSPSGLDADTGKPQGEAIISGRTITFGRPKIGFKNQEAKRYIGKLTVADIGL